ncbi:adenylosuccinate synthetase [Aquisalimonas asiatica]|uniref:Adenylosuccinate synthetase n=1 Tax=Aquisalimonas asiatica TaxID=406100 RepID=A0A1H8T0G2_9GAMM|nr:adenylosuccinate synthetase [Aquisalimonas asiatica]SEO84108.1 adenylosuccinate synthase [Aquisalimonas asiatica]
MPATVIVGGQFGSEGKGKVAYWMAREQGASAAIRVGGANSGHTVVTPNGIRHVLRHLPTAALLPGVQCILGPGSYIDVDVLESEIEAIGLSPERLHIDPHAVIVTAEHKEREAKLGLRNRIGSTQSGTGAAVVDRVARGDDVVLAKDVRRLARFIDQGPARTIVRQVLNRGERIIVEGTQGFGLSVLHAEDYPKATSRDTTASAAAAEAALAPSDIDNVVMVIRAFPIRVAGDSGYLPNESTWEEVSQSAGLPPNSLIETTSVTGSVRRVAEFDPGVIRAALEVNAPNILVLNHLDYCDASVARSGYPSRRVVDFLDNVERQLGQRVDWVGLDDRSLVPRATMVHGLVPATEGRG